MDRNGIRAAVARSFLESTPREIRRSRCSQRSSCRAIAQYTQRKLRGQGGIGDPSRYGRSCCFHRFRVSFWLGGVVSCPEGDEGAANDRHGCNPLQLRTYNDERRNCRYSVAIVQCGFRVALVLSGKSQKPAGYCCGRATPQKKYEPDLGKGAR